MEAMKGKKVCMSYIYSKFFMIFISLMGGAKVEKSSGILSSKFFDLLFSDGGGCGR